MNEVTRKGTYISGLQFASFLLLIFFCLQNGFSLVSIFPLVIAEVILFFQIKKGIRRTVVLWQFQFFLVAFTGLIFNPSSFLNTSVVRESVQIFLVAILLVVEISILSIFRFNERGLIGIFKGSTIALICVVILLIAVVGSEGTAGLYENDPIHMLTTSEFEPYNQPDNVGSLNLTVISNPYDFNLSIFNTIVHMAPSSERWINLTITNNGALNDSYEITSSHDAGIDFMLSSHRINLEAGRSATIRATLTSNSLGNYSVSITIGDEVGKVKNYAIKLIVANDGFDFIENQMFLNVQNSGSSQISIPIGLTNTGIKDSDFLISINSSSIFHPSLNVPEWNYTINSAIIHLLAGETLNCSLIPRMLSQSNGIFQINLTATSLVDYRELAILIITLNIINDQFIYPEISGPIPVSLGHTTHWNITINQGGVKYVIFKSIIPSSGLNASASILNGSAIQPIHNGSMIWLDGNGTATIILRVNQIESSLTNGSSLDVQFVTPGSPLQFGILGLMAGTFILSAIALIIAIPLALGSAIFLAYYCPSRLRRIVKPTMEIIAGIPSVIFGLWGALTFGPFLAQTLYPLINDYLGSFMPFFRGNYQSGGTIMTASIVLGIMIFPIIMALSYEALAAVPSELIEGSRALGVTKWQSIQTVVLRKAKSGILGSIILGTGRAIGETMAVLMILGFTANIPSSVFNATGTMTSSIAAILLSVFSTAQARDGIFAIALLLFIFVLILDALLILVTREKSSKSNRFVKMKSSMRQYGRKIRHIFWSSTKHDVDSIPSIKNLFKSPRTLRRSDRIATGALYFVSAIVLVIIGYIIIDIILRGGLAFQLTYLTETQLSGGGFLNAITGSLMLVGLALVIALPIALMAAIYVNEFTRSNSWLSKIAYISVSTLSSVPSIVFGAFGFILFILILDFGFSLLSGGLTLAIMIIPLIYISSIEGLKTVPNTYREASLALGASKMQTVTNVVIPTSIPSITSGTFLAIGRAIGETAAILITAGFALYLTTSVTEPVASLTNLIYNLFETSVGNVILMQKVYAAAFLLIVIVIAFNLVGKIISQRYSR